MRKTIFVYGSLMEGFWNYQKALEGHVIKKEIGYVQGKLYHMPYKGYPALVPGSDDIQGELLTIDVFEEVEKQLSEIENYYGKNDERNEYEVKSVEVYDIQGKKIIDADVYYYQVERDALFEKEAVYLEKASWRKHLEEIGYIQNLTAADEILIKNYAEKNSVSNLFILGDLHQFGFDKDFQEFYGVKKNNALELLVMRYCNTLCIYGERIISPAAK